MMRSRVFWGLAALVHRCQCHHLGPGVPVCPLLTTWGVEMTTILTSVAMIGPMQVAGRVVLMLLSTRLGTREMGTAMNVLLPTAVLALLVLPTRSCGSVCSPRCSGWGMASPLDCPGARR